MHLPEAPYPTGKAERTRPLLGTEASGGRHLRRRSAQVRLRGRPLPGKESTGGKYSQHSFPRFLLSSYMSLLTMYVIICRRNVFSSDSGTSPKACVNSYSVAPASCLETLRAYSRLPRYRIRSRIQRRSFVDRS